MKGNPQFLIISLFTVSNQNFKGKQTPTKQVSAARPWDVCVRFSHRAQSGAEALTVPRAGPRLAPPVASRVPFIHPPPHVRRHTVLEPECAEMRGHLGST